MNLIPCSWWKRFVALNHNPWIHPFTSFPQVERTVIHAGVINSLTNSIFTITAQILAHSLAKC